MSLLAHPCRQCGHLEDRHAPRERGYQGCRCCNAGSPDLDPRPVLLETYAVPGRRPEPLWPPGARRNAGTSHASVTCACEHCRELAAGLAAPPPPLGATDSVPAPPTGKMGVTTRTP